MPDFTSCSEVSEEEEEKCCICEKWEPEAIRECACVIFVKWAKCDHAPIGPTFFSVHKLSS